MVCIYVCFSNVAMHDRGHAYMYGPYALYQGHTTGRWIAFSVILRALHVKGILFFKK